ncbi:MAG TPA: hypothetical protein VGL58_08500 [Caulobacteraceae bacterium]|jgi:uncharacterized membrane protein
MRSFMIALSAFAIATSALAATPAAGPYKLDAKGKCHAANGQFVTASLCAKPAAAPTSNHCKDPKTHKFVKCGTPGAVPA